MVKENPKSAKVLFPDELKEYMDTRMEGTYTLLDVRQPFEYEKGHLPGARLIPLPGLSDALRDLDSGKSTVVYCAVGGRSRMAAQLLVNQGFREVYHLEGGIEAWEAPTAAGPTEFHLRFVRGDESPAEMVGVAYMMEEGLKLFHEGIKAQTTDPELGNLLTHLIRAEESHERTLLTLLEEESAGADMGKAVPAWQEMSVVEGGIDIKKFMKDNDRFLRDVSGYMELAMMIETQALDLYLRMATESRNEHTRAVLLRIADEEKAHLLMLARFLERSQAGPAQDLFS